MKRFWPEQKEEVVNYVIDNPGCVLTLAYEAWLDIDNYIVFDNKEEFEKYKEDNFKNPYDGWITTNVKFMMSEE